MKGQRQRKIRELIGNTEVETQEELVEYLGEAGMTVTQATVSRDIKEMQLIKVPLEDGRYRYAMPQPQDQRFNPTLKLKRALADHFITAEAAENLVVLKCLPGTAGTIAALIDGMEWPEVVGTIGGDDTTLLIGKTKPQAEDIVKRIQALI